MNRKTEIIFLNFALNLQNTLNMRKARRKNAISGAFWNTFSQKNQPHQLALNLHNSSGVFGGKTLGPWKKLKTFWEIKIQAFWLQTQRTVSSDQLQPQP